MRYRLHDYSAGAGYFITTVTYERQPLFGQVIDGRSLLSELGKVIHQKWELIASRYPQVIRDTFQIMPDHVHFILILRDPVVARIGKEDATNLPAIMHWFKGSSARSINKLRGLKGEPVWQQGYVDRVIRSESELNKFRYYIQTNPQRWQMKHQAAGG